MVPETPENWSDTFGSFVHAAELGALDPDLRYICAGVHWAIPNTPQLMAVQTQRHLRTIAAQLTRIADSLEQLDHTRDQTGHSSPTSAPGNPV